MNNKRTLKRMRLPIVCSPSPYNETGLSSLSFHQTAAHFAHAQATPRVAAYSNGSRLTGFVVDWSTYRRVWT